MDSDFWPGWTPPAQDSFGHRQPLAQRDCTHAGASSQQLAGRILEIREALRHESRAPIPHIHDIQAPVAHSVGDCADCEPAPSTPVSNPGLRPLSPASFPSGSCARSRQDFSAGSGHSIRSANLDLQLFPTRMYLSCRLKVTQVNPKVSGLVGLVF